MEEVSLRPSVEYVPPALPPKARQKGATTLTQIGGDCGASEFGGGADAADGSSMHSLVLNSTPTPATVFVAATRTQRDAAGAHVVTIRVNTDTDRYKTPKISSVHLKSDANLDTLKIENEIYKKNNSLVRITIDETHVDTEHGDRGVERAPYINCNSYPLISMNTLMSSGQCSPSDTLDSGTCSDLDGTPPPLPKKKITKTNARKKAVTVTMISAADACSHNEVDFEDNDSNISCDSLNSSELNGSVHNDDSHGDVNKTKKCNITADEPSSLSKNNGFLPRGLLQDIRDRTTKLNNIDIENKVATIQLDVNDSKTKNVLKTDENRITINNGSQSKIGIKPSIVNITKAPIVIETTYEERNIEDETKTNKQCYSGDYFDTDKFYDFHLNEKQFDVEEIKSDSVKGVDEIDSVEYFAGIKDFKNEESPSTIKSSKGTIRGVKNRVRAGIATFLQINDTAKRPSVRFASLSSTSFPAIEPCAALVPAPAPFPCTLTPPRISTD
ncbi:Glutaredoxin domain-containing cysteine-rich protein CG31559 [Eumeta japonica]|uniref:Glutaredoxin domain-containing cysteine-rich protein CG31559 n=1 Tax=Eumeta variegata TaxID=151549 RepID=A0A4C1VMA0_EUMVA|nr:Glutaredoxin domain-containing cysteine-rich protein CG31559 [Eumeta japonica]